MIKSPFCGAYKIIILGHNHLCLTPKNFTKNLIIFAENKLGGFIGNPPNTSFSYLYSNAIPPIPIPVFIPTPEYVPNLRSKFARLTS